MVRSHDAVKRTEEEPETLQIVDDLESERHGVTDSGTIPVDEASGATTSHASPPLPLPATVITFDPLLSGCPQKRWTPDPETMLFFGPTEQTRGTEVFRDLRSRLYRVREERRLKTLLITSSLPQEGKTFVAANLAQVIALQPGCKVLLIDADLRSPRLHSALGTDATPGFGEYLMDEADEFGVIQKGPWENLYLIPTGRSVAGPSELLANGRLKSLFDRVGPLFDWIILDSPPAIPVSDAGLLSNCCDGVLLVVKSDSTPFDLVRKARQKFREEHLVGVVLNGIESKAPAEIPYGSSRRGSITTKRAS